MTDIDLSDLAADRGGSQPLHGYLATPPGPWSKVLNFARTSSADRMAVPGPQESCPSELEDLSGLAALDGADVGRNDRCQVH
jgi:hypothetical protein